MKKVLIIDDEKSWISILTTRFESEGYHVRGATDPVAGLLEVRMYQPDLIILDLMMPAGGGLTFLKNMRLNLKTRNIPVIVMTASSDDALRREADSLGISAYFSKNFDFNDLREQINKILGASTAP